MRRAILSVASVVLAFGPVVASVNSDIAAIDARATACIDADASNVGMKRCTGDADAAADTLLNTVYAATVKRLKTGAPEDAAINAETLKRLVASERAWIAFRATECDLQGTSMLGGTGEGLVIVNCTLAMTKQRIKSLDSLFSDK